VWIASAWGLFGSGNETKEYIALQYMKSLSQFVSEHGSCEVDAAWVKV